MYGFLYNAVELCIQSSVLSPSHLFSLHCISVANIPVHLLLELVFLRYIWVYSNSFVLEERPKIRRIFLHTPSYSHHFRALLRPGPHMSRVVPRSETVVTVAEHQPLAKASGLVALGCSSSLLPSPCHLVQPHTTGPFLVAEECRMTMFLFIHCHGQTETSSNSSVQSKTVRDTVHRKKSRKNQIYSATICYDSTILLNN